MCIRDSLQTAPVRLGEQLVHVLQRAEQRVDVLVVGDVVAVVVPVSYTHLDVYKRQLQCRSAAIPHADRARNKSDRECASDTVHGSQAVSYTHLTRKRDLFYANRFSMQRR